MNFKKSRVLMWTGYVAGILSMAAGTFFNNEKVTLGFMIAGTIIVAVALVQAIVFYVCPHCGYSLMNVRGGVPEHCPKCGRQLK